PGPADPAATPESKKSGNGRRGKRADKTEQAEFEKAQGDASRDEITGSWAGTDPEPVAPRSPRERYPDMSSPGAQLMLELVINEESLGAWWDTNKERVDALPPADQRAIRAESDAIENRDQVE
ncbi:hypothetical protein LCGC14_3068970, partial [marine sediment metagenome]